MDETNATELDRPGGEQDLTAGFVFELAPAAEGCLRESHVPLVGVREPEDAGRAVARAAVVADLELIEEHDVVTVASEGTRGGGADDTGADDDDVGVETGHELLDHSVRRSRAMRIDLDALFRPGSARPSGWRRMPAIAGEAMVATSHPLATQAGLGALSKGGNAVDAALAAAAVLTVAEPTDNGPGGDAFALVWHDGVLHGLNGSGRSPAVIDELRVDAFGPRSVTVPGAVRAWGDLAERFGRLGLDAALAPAIDLAARGVACTARIARQVGARRARAVAGTGGSVGRYRIPGLERTLRLIADHGPDAVYHGELAAAIAAATWLSEADLAAHRSEWVEPLRFDYRGVEVCELPPNGQGAAALLALALYDGLEPGLHMQIEAMKLALSDAHAVVHDGPLPDDFLVRRAAGAPQVAAESRRRRRSAAVRRSAWRHHLPVRGRR